MRQILKTPQRDEMSRLDKVRYFFDRSQRGLEIGASFNPVVPKADGWNVQTIDHASRAELVAKYLPRGRAVDKIEEVDFVWHGEPLEVLVGDHGSYDYFVASHVIEHLPDLLGFFQSVETLLKDSGILSLVVPDKRYCFDFFKSLTMTSDLLGAHDERRTIHSKKTIFEHIAYHSSRNGSSIWDVRQQGEIQLDHSLEEAYSAFNAYDAATKNGYIDMHHSYFVPASFELIIEELRALGLISFEIAKTFPGAGCEFYVSLRKTGVRPPADPTLNLRRLALMKQIVEQMTSVR